MRLGFLVPDLHGNVAAAVGSSFDAVSDALRYDAWGRLVASITRSLPSPWRYQGSLEVSAPGTSELYDAGPALCSPDTGPRFPRWTFSARPWR